MVYLLYGDNAFAIQETLASMKSEMGLADLHDVNIIVFDGALVSFNELVATCDTVPFLAEKRMVIVRGLLSLFERRAPSRARDRGGAPKAPNLASGQWQGLAQYVAKVPETTDLIFVEGRLSGTNSLLAALRPQVTIRTFPMPNPGELRQWIRSRALANGLDIEHRAVDTLAETIGGDLGVIALELEKLSLYRWRETIRQEDVEELVSYAKEGNIFAAVDALLEGRPSVAMGLVHELLQAGRPTSYILTMIARQVRLLILAKELKAKEVPATQQGQRLGLSGYPLRKTLEQEPRFSAQRLVEIHRKLLEADVTIKSTGTDDELVLDVLIAEVAGAPAGGGSAAFRRSYSR